MSDQMEKAPTKGETPETDAHFLNVTCSTANDTGWALRYMTDFARSLELSRNAERERADKADRTCLELTAEMSKEFVRLCEERDTAESALKAVQRDWQDEHNELRKKCACEFTPFDGQTPPELVTECGYHGELRSALKAAREDSERLAYVYSGKQTACAALVKLELRLIDNDVPTIDEVRAAIDRARAE